jgi:hypothetical protein
MEDVMSNVSTQNHVVHIDRDDFIAAAARVARPAPPRNNGLEAMLRILEPWYNDEFPSLFMWIWTGDIVCLARLAAISRTMGWRTSFPCTDCYYRPRYRLDRQRRITIPYWISENVYDIMLWNGRCHEHSVTFIRTNLEIFCRICDPEQVARVGMWCIHDIRCACDVCHDGRLRGRIHH